MSFEVRRATAAETFPLRQRVLRPDDTTDELSDRGSDFDHFAASTDGEVIGSAAVRREAPPGAAGRDASWRLRGMATSEGRRGRGVGTALLEAVIAHVGQRGGRRLWCNARTSAVAFYQRAGFVTRGEAWNDPVIGPHIAMELLLESASRVDAVSVSMNRSGSSPRARGSDPRDRRR
jgi:GNAT superfamily N-acetyltransferase